MGLLDNLVNKFRGKLIQAGEKRSRQRIEPTSPEGAALRQQREDPITYNDQNLKSSGYKGLSNLDKIKKRNQINAEGDKAFKSGSGYDMLTALRKGTSATKATQGITYGDVDKDILAARETRAARLEKQKDLRAKKDATEKGKKDKEEKARRDAEAARYIGSLGAESTYYGDVANVIREAFQTNEKKGSCWKGYKSKGMKKKNGRMVPNCVPVSESIERIGQLINEKLCAKGKAAAKRKYDVYPSAYANMYASAVCSGKVKSKGKKK